MKTLVIAAVLALAGLGGSKVPTMAPCKGAAWCGWHQVKVNGVLTACHQYSCRTHGKVEHSESH
jgi:hypothetical protein